MQLLRNFVFIAVLASLLMADGFVYQEYLQTKCGTKQFQCNSEQCIDDWKQCDGEINCDDGSDETLELCSSLKCPPYSFKCAYGACIYSNLMCNGIKNCRDNSDEEGCFEFPRAPIMASRLNVEIPSGNDCVLPEFSDYGKWLLLGSKDFLPGDIVPANTLLLLTCQTNYTLMPDKTLARCDKTFGDLPICIKTCPTISGNNLTLSCARGGKAVSCTKPYEGTKAIVRCTNLYEVPSEVTGLFRFCHDGSWDNWQLNCEQVCGVSSVIAEPGSSLKDVARGEFPWHVGVYWNVQPVCAGSLITPKLVLTAAHCFHQPPEMYMVAAGKSYMSINNTNDDQPQYSKVSKIIPHKDYKDFQGVFDLAVVVLANPFQLTMYVMPVCLDLSNNFNMSSLTKKMGIIVGWGFNRAISLLDPLAHVKYLAVQYYTQNRCESFPEIQKHYIQHVPDKFCAIGNLNVTRSRRGTGGGGLVYPEDNGFYFLRGVTSVQSVEIYPKYDFSIYTSVQYHTDLITKSMREYRD